MRMDRRTAMGAVSALALTPWTGRLGAAPARRPNILFLLADDWGWGGALPIDPSRAKLPNVARVARDGISFTNAFAAAPSCTASRGAILSGQWPWRLREGANLQGSLPRDIPLYTELLAQAGYHVGATGKGWAPGSIEAAGRTQNPAGRDYASFDAFLAARPAGAGFCFWMGTNDPHRPFRKGAGVASGIDPRSVEVPPYLPDTPAVRSDIADYRFCLERMDRDLGQVLTRLERDGELNNTVVVVTGDNGWPFPRGKATLFDAGWHVPLTVMWPGRIGGGRRSDAMVSLIDLAPTFLEVAGLPRPAVMNGQSLVGLLTGDRTTHRAFVIGATERHMDGRSVQGQGYPARAIRTPDHLFICNLRPDRWPAGDPERRSVTAAAVEDDLWAAFADIDKGPTKAQLVTDPALRHYRDLATAKRPARMLFDVRSDPFEFRNLAGDPHQRHVQARLERRLDTVLRATGDPRTIDPADDRFDRYTPNASGIFARPADWADR